MIVSEPKDYLFSSAMDYAGDKGLLEIHFFLPLFQNLATMQVIEFNTDITGRSIEIPPEYQDVQKKKVKVTLEWEEPQNERNYDPERIKMLLAEIQGMGVFDSIDDPVEWQKELRDEWE